MDITDNNFKIMSDYLANTLNPDVNVRRPGKWRKILISPFGKFKLCFPL